MATLSPLPISTPSALPPAPATPSPPPTTSASPPPELSSSPPPNNTATPPPSLPSANPSDPPSSLIQSPPPATLSAPPPPTIPSSPPPQPPVMSEPPPQSPHSPPAPTEAPPPRLSVGAPPPPPPSSVPAASSTPPPPSTNPPKTSAPPPPTSSDLPVSSPPPPPSQPLQKPPPPPKSKPPEISPRPPASEHPENSPPPPTAVPPRRMPSPPASEPPPPETIRPGNASPPPPSHDPTSPAQAAPPPSNSSSMSSSPPPLMGLAPPPPQVPSPLSDDPSVNNSSHSAPDISGSSGDSGIGTGTLVGIGVGLGLVFLSLIGFAVWCLMKRKRHFSRIRGGYVIPSSMGCSPRSDSAFLKMHRSSATLVGRSTGSDYVYSPSEPGGLGHSKALFTYEELVKATNGFSSQNLLGEGGFGFVYKGLLPDGREVAVKQLKIGGGQGEREFKAEVETISRIHHRHLVSLVGYCISNDRRLLVYDYVPNNNLYFHLHGEGRPVLHWATRVKIAAGAARGIAYLHEDCHPRIIHRDIKSSNILLNDNFEAQVSDFGLAKLALDANTHVTTRVIGTFGYMAPEYASSGKLTEKSDIFSFGVVLLELITGRKPVDASQPLGDESLVEWARPLLSNALETEEFEALADPRLGGNYVDGEMFRLIEAAAACVRHSAVKRPRMGQVVRAFDGLASEDLTNGMKLGESEMYNSAQQSAEIRLFRRMAFGSQNYSTDFFTHSSWNSRDEICKYQETDESFVDH